MSRFRAQPLRRSRSELSLSKPDPIVLTVESEKKTSSSYNQTSNSRTIEVGIGHNYNEANRDLLDTLLAAQSYKSCRFEPQQPGDERSEITVTDDTVKYNCCFKPGLSDLYQLFENGAELRNRERNNGYSSSLTRHGRQNLNMQPEAAVTNYARLLCARIKLTSPVFIAQQITGIDQGLMMQLTGRELADLVIGQNRDRMVSSRLHNIYYTLKRQYLKV